ncbi:MAG TPA: MFS transporter [Symbiobacteriaceae bacterium]
MNHPQRIPYTIIALGTIATLGGWGGAKGVIFPDFLQDLSLAPALGSAIFTATSVGSFIGSSSFAALSNRFGLSWVNRMGALLLAGITCVILFVRQPAFLYAAFVLFGLGWSMLELSSSLPISLLYAREQGSIMNLLHSFFGVGTITGSLLAGWAMSHGANWRLPMGVVVLLAGLWAYAYQRQPALSLPPRAKTEKGNGSLLRDPVVWTATLALTAGVAAEAGAGIWLPTYLSQGKGLDVAGSTLGATLFFLGFTASRLCGALLVGRMGSVRSVFSAAAVGAAGLAGVMLLPASWFWLTVLAGLGVGIIFPTCLTLVAERYQSRSNAVFSLIYACANVAGIATGPAMGMVVQGRGVTAAVWMLLSFYTAVMFFIGYCGWALAHRPAGSATRPAA